MILLTSLFLKIIFIVIGIVCLLALLSLFALFIVVSYKIANDFGESSENPDNLPDQGLQHSFGPPYPFDNNL
jgi:hypothetical protein